VSIGYDTGSVWAKLADLYNPANDFSDPVRWVTNKAKAYPWSTQREICESVRDNRYTAVPSCHGVGKSWIVAQLIAWWIDSHPVGTAFVVSTAPSAAQVSAVMWREVAKTHRKLGLEGRITTAGYPMWKIGPELVGYGRKPADYEESAFQGIHARHVLIVIDEACGVVEHLFNAVDSLATNENARVVAIGNPDDPSSHFAKICQPDSLWNVIQIDALRTPGMSEAKVIGADPARPLFPLTAQLMRAERIPFSNEVLPPELYSDLTGPLWVEERIRNWAGVGEREQLDDDALIRRCAASAIFMAKARGVFPTTSNTGVIPLGWVQQAVNRWHDWDDAGRPEVPGRIVIGVDVARGVGENDESALAIRQGNVVRSIETFKTDDTIETAERAARYLHTPQSMSVVDVIGIGAGVYDQLRRWSADNTILSENIPFNASGQSHRTDLLGSFVFRNDRAAAWWNFRELLDPSRGSKIALPDDERLMQELTAPGYDHYVGGRLKVEEKDEIRKRIGRSTDRADAVIMAYWVQGMAFDHNGDSGFPYRQREQRDGIFGYGGNTFSERDLVTEPGLGRYSDRAMPERSTYGAPSFGTLPGDNWGSSWEV
jgi:hypothetical protein